MQINKKIETNNRKKKKRTMDMHRHFTEGESQLANNHTRRLEVPPDYQSEKNPIEHHRDCISHRQTDISYKVWQYQVLMRMR